MPTNNEYALMKLGEEYHCAYMKLIGLYKEINQIINQDKDVFRGELMPLRNLSFITDNLSIVHFTLYCCDSSLCGED